TQVTNITADNSLTGDVEIRESDAANVLFVSATNGNATVITDTGDLNVDQVLASLTATLTATTGAITDLNGFAVTNVTAQALVATAATGISLDTDVAEITAHNTGTGDIFLVEFDDVDVLDVTDADGDVHVTSFTGSLNVFNVDASGAANLIADVAITDGNGPG